MRRSALLLIHVLVCLFELSNQACQECACCSIGENACDPTSKTCTNGCIAGYHGDKCTEDCLKNCTTCISQYTCTECKPGYYGNKCDSHCGTGCVNNTCDISGGACPCKSTDFYEGNCKFCVGNKYGNECNNTCPLNCLTCVSGTECAICKNLLYYGSLCQYRCSNGCDAAGKCNSHTGRCNQRCKSGFTGDKCDTCLPGKYGYNCDLDCVGNCSVCFSEINCTECQKGFYGETCSLSCHTGCKGNCSFADGRCLDCKPGLSGEFCNSTCIDGTYGNKCSRFCNEVDAHCQRCSTDKSGQYSDCTQCSSGYYPVYPFELNSSTCYSCPSNCKENECNKSGLCSLGCSRGKWGGSCKNNCTLNCIECSQSDGKCLECTNETFSDDCSQNCSTNCNMTGIGRTCASDTGKCLHGCMTFTMYGDFCENQCNDTCNNQSCYWKTGKCLEGCVMNFYGSLCDKKCADTCKSEEGKRVCEYGNGHCLLECNDGFHGEKCENICSSSCLNTTCKQETGECFHGCIDGYEGVKCVKASGRSGKDKTVIIAASAGAGFAFIILVVILVICLIRRKRKQRLPTSNKSEENDLSHDMQEFRKENDYSEPDADDRYAQPFKSKSNATFEINDTEKKTSGIPNSNNDYAVVNKPKFVKKKNEITEEVYDTTHDTKNKRPADSNNEYAVLSMKSNKLAHIVKSNGAKPEDEHDMYDTTEENKSKTIPHLDNEYASINCNKGGMSDTHKESSLYDTTNENTCEKMRPVNNDYDVFSFESEQTLSTK